MNNDRLKHSISVGRKMVEFGQKYNLSDKELTELFLLGYVHDIGYEYAENSIEHNIVGGNILKQSGYKYWKEVYYNGKSNSEYKSLYLAILNEADMQIDKYGNEVGFDKRLDDIKNRYGENSKPYLCSKQIIDSIKKQKVGSYEK